MEMPPVPAPIPAADQPPSEETARALVNPLYAIYNEETQKWERRVDKLTGKPLWPWPQLYFKDRVAFSDRIYEVAKDGSYRLIFKFTKKFLKRLKRDREAAVATA